MKRLSIAAIIVPLLLTVLPAASGQSDITLIAPLGAKAAIEELITKFESKSGYKVKPTYGSGLGTKQQVIKGAAFDVPVVQPPYQDVLSSGNVAADSATPLATVSVGVAVRKGASKPNISTVESVKEMLLAARSISYPDPATGAAAGVGFNETLKKLGIFEQIKSKIKLGPAGGGAMALLANGEVEVGLTFLSEMENPGIDIVGPLPQEIASPTSLVGFVSTRATDPKAARALLDFLSSPEATSTYKKMRMQPSH